MESAKMEEKQDHFYVPSIKKMYKLITVPCVCDFSTNSYN